MGTFGLYLLSIIYLYCWLSCLFLFQKVSPTDEFYIKRKKMIKRKMSSSNKAHNAPKNTGGMLFSNPPNNFFTEERKPEYLESSPLTFAPYKN